MRAYHDGGQYAGLDYDDDYGGSLYVDGDEGLNIPAIDSEADLRAKDEAKRLFEGLVLRDRLQQGRSSKAVSHLGHFAHIVMF
ncbi:hypothetical protein GYM54_01375 [Pseudomonas sp. MTM4]|uniref:hypothetical protein n=1 Tax=unclassified Pseudomonas TaxID=196821 RepID=UPI0018D20BFD|nr:MULTISPECIES: hypothetical protein [unclassified Pseudomonas]MBC8648389.1 hypothetical protein [Pseudomonas sp. MT4]QXY90334.1 hypothetical protein GYM54_01375 [Pseudomonas sp. MTM4]